MIRQGSQYFTYFCSRFLAVVFNNEVPSFTPFSDEFVVLLVLVIEGLFGGFSRTSFGIQGAYPSFFHLLFSCRDGLRLAVAIDDDIFRTGDLAHI